MQDRLRESLSGHAEGPVRIGKDRIKWYAKEWARSRSALATMSGALNRLQPGLRIRSRPVVLVCEREVEGHG